VASASDFAFVAANKKRNDVGGAIFRSGEFDARIFGLN
jgi:hypothetical protein